MAERSRHTLLLVQYNHSLASRTFLDFTSLAAALDGVCLLYEKELKALNPSMTNITYDISDLYSYLDQLADIALLVYAARRTLARPAASHSSHFRVASCCAWTTTCAAFEGPAVDVASAKK